MSDVIAVIWLLTGVLIVGVAWFSPDRFRELFRPRMMWLKVVLAAVGTLLFAGVLLSRFTDISLLGAPIGQVASLGLATYIWARLLWLGFGRSPNPLP